MHTKGEYINGISETTVVGELALDLGMIDPKVDLARIRLAVGDAPMAVDPQMESASLLGIVATDQIAQRIPKIVVDLCPQGDRKRPPDTLATSRNQSSLVGRIRSSSV